jgi:hypothetical protein
MNAQNVNKKFASYNQDDNYITCPSGFKYYLSFSGRIPFHILIDDDLNATDIKLYAIIEGLSFAFKSSNKYNYVSNNDLCFLLGLNEKSTAYERSVKKLKDKNLVKREKKTITEKGRTFKGWCWSIESGNFYTMIKDNERQVPHQEWDTEDKYPTSGGGAVPHQEWDQRTVNKISKESITFSNTKESQNSIAVIRNKSLAALQEINTLDLPTEFLERLIAIRKVNKGSMNKGAMEAVYQELIKLKEAGLDLNECLSVYANCGWRGFVAEWFIKIKKTNKNPHEFYSSNDVSWGEEMKNNPFYQGLLD